MSFVASFVLLYSCNAAFCRSRLAVASSSVSVMLIVKLLAGVAFGRRRACHPVAAVRHRSCSGSCASDGSSSVMRWSHPGCCPTPNAAAEALSAARLRVGARTVNGLRAVVLRGRAHAVVAVAERDDVVVTFVDNIYQSVRLV